MFPRSGCCFCYFSVVVIVVLILDLRNWHEYSCYLKRINWPFDSTRLHEINNQPDVSIVGTDFTYEKKRHSTHTHTLSHTPLLLLTTHLFFLRVNKAILALRTILMLVLKFSARAHFIFRAAFRINCASFAHIAKWYRINVICHFIKDSNHIVNCCCIKQSEWKIPITFYL